MRTVTFTLNIAGRARASATARSKRGSFYLWIAAAMTCTVFTGFWFTYFGPLFGGSYQQVSLIVHVHGWTFFAWYLLLTMQAGLVRFGQVAIHRMLGIASMALAMFMCGVGVIVSTVRIDMGLGPKGDPFWALMGLPIFAVWILFTSFYVAAVYRRRRAEHHKRFMVLASSAAMSAATFRIFVQIFGFETWVAIVGAVSPALFIVAAMINDLQNARRIHPVYAWGFTATVTLIGVAFLLAMTSSGEVPKQGLGWLGRALRPLY